MHTDADSLVKLLVRHEEITGFFFYKFFLSIQFLGKTYTGIGKQVHYAN